MNLPGCFAFYKQFVHQVGAVGTDKIIRWQFVLKPLQNLRHGNGVSFIRTVDAAVIAAGLYTDDAAGLLQDHTLYDRNGNRIQWNVLDHQI